MVKVYRLRYKNFSKITCKIVADYLDIAPMAVSIGMRNKTLPVYLRYIKKTTIGNIKIRINILVL